jgi:CubicO group peptidase (beta-lactamase class C family)
MFWYMLWHFRKAYLLSSLLVVTLSLSGQQAASKIDSLLTAYFRNGVFNGTVLVSRNNVVIFKKAYGIADRDWNIPIADDTKFKIASISKPFTALLVVQLAEEGKLNLNGTIKDYIPDYKGKSGDSITIHQLLTHTSGILASIDPREEEIEEKQYHDLRSMVGFAEKAGLYFKPGTGFRYSNLAYSILALIIERVTGKSYEIALKEKILAPADLTDTRQFQNAIIEDRLAKGYEYKLLSGLENASDYDASYTVGPGGLISTAGDLYLFDQALYSNILISEEYRRKIFMPASTGNYGYGWFITNKKINSGHDSILVADHSGSINGFGSYMARIMSDSSLVIILKNQKADTYIDPAFAPEIGSQIISILYGDSVGLPKKSIARHLALKIGTQCVDSAIEEYKRIIKSGSADYSLEESELNRLGIELLFKFNRTDDALKIFELNRQQFPHSYNTYDSYAYVLKEQGDYLNSIKYYRKGLDVLKKYPGDNDLNAVRKDAEQALRYIIEMEELINQRK